MATENQLLDVINKAIEEFHKKIPTLQRDAFADLVKIASQFETNPDGSLKNSIKNLRLLNTVRNKLVKVTLTDDYHKAVSNYAWVFREVTKMQNSFFKKLERDFTPAPLLEELRKQTVSDVVNSLTGVGVTNTAADALTQIIKTNLTSGSSYKSLTKQLMDAMIGKDDNGMIARHGKTYVVDAVNEYSRTYMQTVSGDLGFEWYRYQGKDITTTRPFCDAMTDQPFFHVSEVPRLLRAEDLYWVNPKTGQREQVKLSSTTGLPNGLKAGTDVSNFFVRAGGWNCGHQIFPVTEKQVPAEIVTRVKNTREYRSFKGLTEDDDFEKLIKMRAKAAPVLEKIGKDIASKYGSVVTEVNYKGEGSMQRKATDEYDGEVGFINDAVRSTVVDSIEDVNRIVAELQKHPLTYKYKAQSHDTDPLGYSGNIFNLKMEDGLLVELQVNTPEMIFAKEKPEDAIRILGQKKWDEISDMVGLEGGLGHKYYEEWRKILDENSPRRAELEQLSKEYYKHFIPNSPVLEAKAVAFAKANPIRQGESQKEYAKRVIDKLKLVPPPPPPGRNYDFFNQRSPVDERVPIDKFKLADDYQINPETITNAKKRMWASSKGLLWKRDIIKARKNPDGTYTIVDGNSTFLVLKEAGWDEIPVTIEVGVVQDLELDETTIFNTKTLQKFGEYQDRKVKFNKLATDDDVRQVAYYVQDWGGSSNRIRNLKDTDPVKKFFHAAAAKLKTGFTRAFRGEKFVTNWGGDESIFQHLYGNVKVGSVIDFSTPVEIQASELLNKVKIDRRLNSFTHEKDVSQDFSGRLKITGGMRRVILEVENPDGIFGWHVEKMTGIETEREIIVGDHHKYEVIDIKEEKEMVDGEWGYIHRIKLRQIPN
jgi:hypothetical protein